MECNKEEAIRAKGIAEQKMQNGDFEGAKKFALKAQKLFPELDNITQLLAVCNVHYCAKNNTHGSEKDLYGILQIEPLADESLVKKQFRKLALLLHPDKNKFPGAEAAFKLIGEANRILTDQKTRSQYDLKCRVSVKTIPKPTSHPSNKSSTVDNQPDLTNYRNGSSKFTTSNAYQQAQHLVFWTSCSACGFKFQFNKDFVNRMLPCLSCRCIFIAQDLGPQGYPWSQFPSQNPCNSYSQHNSDKPSGVHFPHKFAGSGPIPTADSKKQEKVGVKMNQSKESLTTQKDEFPNMRDRKKGVEMPTATKTEESGTSRKARKKRGRKSVEESDKSCETGGGIEVENVVSKEYCNNNTEANSKVSGGNPPRRSSRQKQPVSYEEKLADDDFESPYKKSKLMTPPKANEEKLDDEVMKKYNSGGLRKKEVEHKASAPPEDDVLIKKRKIGDSEGKEEETVILDNSKVHQFDSGFESSRDVNPSLELEYPDPEFTDFEKYRADNCFAVNQLQITWLEADPDEENQQDWVELDLPVSCGKYCNGSSETCVDRLMFSHQIDPIKCSSKCFFVYPQKGETWALFKDWDAKWVSEPEKHKPPYDYDFVEVLAGFDEEVGIGVAHLCKVKGFVSIFQQTEHDGVISFHISSCELYRFSHPVPSFRMTGNEREGIPVGSFELDPASLPAYLFELVDSNDMKLGNHNAENCSGPNHPQNQAKATKDSESNLTPVSNQMGETEKEVSASRITREPRCMLKDLGQVDAVHYKNEDDSTETLRDCNLTHPKGSSISDDAIEKTNTPKNCKKNYLTKDCLTPRKSPRDLSRRISQANASQHDTGEDGKKHSVSNKNEKPGSFGNTEGIVSLNPPVGHMHQHRR
ncbi:Bifunctional 3-dehydroquinate dehydratase/shikimate dehydrogenase isoform 1 [Hibiscus syriacus]|uniref:Bifunctional 3-dehydroquinate dehydratase/shikimate dehydrogenase isoform 1 n=1 Tax=Hibiscus syriacus TaxID=106335 RepID=A0A6A3BWH3_HIBSY|nr:Bifunctional 3-dehydroquinate dehydratase/shikimate dehydrogenase isoform 1 [Hibiscus syriacus]